MSRPSGRGGPMSSATEKPQNIRKVLRQLYNYIHQQRLMFLVAIGLSIMASGFQLLGPYLTGEIIDLIKLGQFERDFPQIIRIVQWMLVFYVFSSFFLYALQALMIRISQKIVVKMRQNLFEKFMDLPISYFDRHQIGDMISRISYDIDTINTSLSSDVVQIFGSVITIFGALVMMVIISPVLLLVFVITIPTALYTTRYLARKTRPLYRVRSQKLGELNGFVEETVSGIKTIKAYSQEKTMTIDFMKKNSEASEAYYRADYYGGIMGPSIGFINNISLALISMFGSLLYLFNIISVGNISSFILYSRKFSGPITEGANMIAELQSTLAAAERVFKVLDEDSEIETVYPTSFKKDVAGEVVFENVSFSYLPHVEVIKNLSFKAKPGSLIAIVGPTGAGKTTLINLLMRFYDVNEGRISIDGIDIKKLSRNELRTQFAMVLQDTWLFHGSIYDNIAYGRPGVSLQEVQKIAKEVNIDHFIERLKDGYDTLITDDGINISKGQKQLITIARAMLQNRRMIILDEATSNVDTRTEKRIQVAMRKLMQDKTCFVIAHRLSTIQNADIILVVNDGQIVEQGNHQMLMDNQGFYYQMYMSQFD